MSHEHMPRREFLRILGYGIASILAGLPLLRFMGFDLKKIPQTVSGRTIGSALYKDWYDFDVERAPTTGKNSETGISNSTIVRSNIQAALDKLTPGRSSPEIVKISGVHTVGRIEIPSYTTSDLRDAKLILKNSTNDNLIVNDDPIKGNTQINVIGGLLDGNKNNNSQGRTDDFINTLHFEKVTDSIVQNIDVYNSPGHALKLKTCSNVRILLPTVKNSRKEGVSIRDGVRNCCLGGFFYNTGWSFITTLNTSDAKIHGNYGHTTNNHSSGISPNGLRNSITDNTIVNTDGPAITLAQNNQPMFDGSGSIIARNSCVIYRTCC